MSRNEKIFTIFYWCYVAVYVPCFLLAITSGAGDRLFRFILPFHLFGMLIGIPMLFILFRDVYRREFPNPNSKVTWTIATVSYTHLTLPTKA